MARDDVDVKVAVDRDVGGKVTVDDRDAEVAVDVGGKVTVDREDVEVAVDVDGKLTVNDKDVGGKMTVDNEDVEVAVDVAGTGAMDDEDVEVAVDNESAEEVPDVSGKLSVDNEVDVEVDVDDEVEDDKAVVKEQFMHLHVVIKCRHKFDTLVWKWAYRRFSQVFVDTLYMTYKPSTFQLFNVKVCILI